MTLELLNGRNPAGDRRLLTALGRTPTMTLTPRQRDTLEAIKAHRTEHGHSPTYPELAERLSVAIGTVSEHVRGLLAAGALVRDTDQVHRHGGARRSLVPVDEGNVAGVRRHVNEATAILEALADGSTDRKLKSARRRARELLEVIRIEHVETATTAAASAA
jgi:DNA-binding MarR family transcriptional regulator